MTAEQLREMLAEEVNNLRPVHPNPPRSRHRDSSGFSLQKTISTILYKVANWVSTNENHRVLLEELSALRHEIHHTRQEVARLKGEVCSTEDFQVAASLQNELTRNLMLGLKSLERDIVLTNDKGVDEIRQAVLDAKTHLSFGDDELKQTVRDAEARLSAGADELKKMIDHGKEQLLSARSEYMGDHKIFVRTKRDFKLICDSRDISVTPTLLKDREWDPPLGSLLERYLPLGGSYLEIGAHIGYFTMYACQLVGHKGQVFAFEANPATFEYLETNSRLNDVGYLCNTYNQAVYHKSTTLSFNTFTRNQGGSSLATYGSKLLHEFREQPTKIDVPTISLDEFSKDKELAFDFIKIDAEGSEMDILEGGKRFFGSCLKDSAVISLELNPPALEGLGRTSEEVLTLAQAFGFHIYNRSNINVLAEIHHISQIDSWCITELLLSKKALA